MAFLCPSRRGRQKKKKKESKAPFMGRITGSASVDTLVRVGLEKQHGLSPESRMRVTQDFLATTDDELSAQTGDIVYKLFEDNEWVYVISEQSQEGFVPFICVTPLKDTSQAPDPQGSFKRKTKQQPQQLLSKSNDSMLAEEGSDTSNGSRTKENAPGVSKPNGEDNTAPPKPARGLPLDIPDVIGGNQHQHHHHQSSRSHHNHHQKQHPGCPVDLRPAKLAGGEHTGKLSPPSTNVHNNVHRSILSGGQGQRVSLSSSVSGGESALEAGLQRHQRKSTNSNLMPPDTPLTSSQTSLSSDPITEVRTFNRKPRGKLLVIFPFEAWDEGDMSVDRGEVVTALNTEDPLWTMVRKLNGQEGFVPAAFTCNYPDDLPGGIGSGSEDRTQRGGQQTRKTNYHDVRDLVTLRQFTAQSADDISVEGGEQVFADLANQIEREWLWVYAPSTGKYGYIPRDNVVHADTTPIPKDSEIRNFAQRPP